MSAVVTWVSGITAQAGESQYSYQSHCCGRCGAGQTQLCGPTYYLASSNPKNAPKIPYSLIDKTLSEGVCTTSENPGHGSCVNYKLCPIIGNICPQVQYEPNNVDNLSCLYPLSTFTELSYVKDFINKFPDQETDPNSDYNQLVLPFFCQTPTTSCPEDPTTGLPMSACSRFVTTDASDPCRTLLGTVSDQEGNAAKSAYCAVNNTPDCLCINRFDNPIYQAMSLGESFQSDSCWWKACQDSPTDPSTYLVLSDDPPPCSAQDIQDCQSVGIVLGGNSQNLTVNENDYTDCTVNSNGSPDGPTNGGGNTLWDNWWWLILLVTGAIIVIVILIIILTR